ncbi:hypothetical protein CVH13_01542 [Dehalococcoides mccartyi]|jgi:hypothetical protein|uniref:Uncharacterized protein n=1 Tax=Dehalococcoides mccartyi TaxID=61435 RepID=A0A2J1DTB4_9CHLR|nr:hypothetical protein B1777_04935 [Dehalococcoides mccartyi]PKH45363.1 hypothetical protein CVH13_01542 [Dehalococcoides mccartyi]
MRHLKAVWQGGLFIEGLRPKNRLHESPGTHHLIVTKASPQFDDQNLIGKRVAIPVCGPMYWEVME